MPNICRLCNQVADLQESHIIPHFVYKWQKKTSATGFIRFGQQPNQRVQDGLKMRMLCSNCESLLNNWETEFANNIFHPFTQGNTDSALYGPWFLKLCVSVSWRALNFFMEENILSSFPEPLQKSAKQAQNVWREFLLDHLPHPDQHEQHFLPLDAIESHTSQNMPPNISRYFLRTVALDAVHWTNTAFIYSKLGPFLILGFFEMPQRKQWVGTKVHVKHGTIRPRKYELPQPFENYLLDKARNVSKIKGSISQKQKKKIDETFRNNLDRAKNSESFLALGHDVRMFGNAAFTDKKK